MSRKYAEDLVGSLNRDIYNNQRNVAQQSYKTDWQDLQNQYKSLQESIKRKQEEANLAFNKGLINVAEGSYDRMANANSNLSSRGLSGSGISDLVRQEDIAQKGSDVLSLLGNAGDVAVSVASDLASGSNQINEQNRNLGSSLSDVLGNIGNNETEAQMDYNTALANIAEGKIARDEANELSARQRAASGSSSSSNKYDDETEELYKRLAISEILSSPMMTDEEKARNMQLYFGIGDASNIVNAYNYNTQATERYNNDYNNLLSTYDSGQDRISNLQDTLNRYRNNNNITNNNNNKNNYYSGDNVGLDSLYYNSPNASLSNISSNVNNNKIISNYERMLEQAIADSNAKNDELSKYISRGVTYKDLANLLYGNR